MKAKTTRPKLDTAALLALARLGAPERLRQLESERRAILRLVPTLDGASERPRRRMSAAARKAVSKRMRKYWAARRKGA
jgi:hypothetical protein